MREYFKALAENKKNITISFPASAGGKLVTSSGTVTEVGEDFIIMSDIYGNMMFIPFHSITCVEVKK